jgi:hypothetical protein
MVTHTVIVIGAREGAGRGGEIILLNCCKWLQMNSAFFTVRPLLPNLSFPPTWSAAPRPAEATRRRVSLSGASPGVTATSCTQATTPNVPASPKRQPLLGQ